MYYLIQLYYKAGRDIPLIVNVVIIAAILSFVVLYSGYESEDYYRRQIEYFENTTVTMENVTEEQLTHKNGTNG